MNLRILFFLIAACYLLTSSSVYANELVSEGARVYVERCVLCHGNNGLGDGVVPLLIEDYPDTSLRSKSNLPDLGHLVKSIALGGESASHSEYSPPWKDELSKKEIDAVAAFVRLLQQDLSSAIEHVDIAAKQTPSRIEGEHIFLARCAACHGAEGRGDGHLRRIVNRPPPSDLTRSMMTEDQLTTIIAAGGEALNLSRQMPPWGQELSARDIEKVVSFTMSLRDECQNGIHCIQKSELDKK